MTDADVQDVVDAIKDAYAEARTAVAAGAAS